MSRTKLAQLGSSRCPVVMPEDLKGVKLVDLAPMLSVPLDSLQIMVSSLDGTKCMSCVHLLVWGSVVG